MNYKITCHVDDDIYDVVVSGPAVLKVTKFLGDSQYPRDVLFEELSRDVQVQILEEVMNHLENECN